MRMKVSNLVALDPDAETRGMSRGRGLDAEVFGEFRSDLPRLRATAEAIRANLTTLHPGEAETEAGEVVEDPRGSHPDADASRS